MGQPLSKVYFFQEQGPDNLIKIGLSADHCRRTEQVKGWCPYGGSLLAWTSGSRALECWLHERFAGSRVRGEWFRPTAQLLAMIGEIQATGAFKDKPLQLATPPLSLYCSNLDSVLIDIGKSLRWLSEVTGISISTLAKAKGHHKPPLSGASIARISQVASAHGYEVQLADLIRPRTDCLNA